jgi:hypothetical protein
VERDLGQARDLAQPAHVVGDQRVVGAQHRAEPPHTLGTALDALFVEVVAEHVHAVRAGQVVELVAVQIGDLHTARGFEKRADLEVLPQVAAVLERNPVGARELQVGDGVFDLRGQPIGRGEALPVQLRQARERCAALRGDLGRGAVRGEEARLTVFVERHQARHAPRDARVPAQRRMLGARELQANPQLVQRQREPRRSQRVRRQSDVHHGLDPCLSSRPTYLTGSPAS